MIRVHATTPALRPPGFASPENQDRLDRALEELVDDEWIDDFIRRLNYAIEDVVRHKR